MRAAAVQEVQTAVELASANNYVLIASFTVYLFDHSIVLGQEIEYLWRYRFSAVAALAVLLHGATVVNFGLLCYEDLVDLDCHSALLGTIASQITLAVYDIIIAVITALRVYAINGQSWPLPSIVLVLSLIRVVFDIFGTATKTTDPLPSPLGCAVESTSSLNIPFFIAATATSSVADAIVLVVTWLRTYHTIRVKRHDPERPSLSFLLWRDGSIYFGSLLLISILDVAIYTAVTFQGFQYLRLAFSTMILSRFFLNLREANHTMDSLDSDTSSGPVVLTSLGFHNFSRAADVFGGSLTFIGDDVNVERIADDEGYGDEMAYGEALEEEDSRVPTAVGKQKDTYTACSA